MIRIVGGYSIPEVIETPVVFDGVDNDTKVETKSKNCSIETKAENCETKKEKSEEKEVKNEEIEIKETVFENKRDRIWLERKMKRYSADQKTNDDIKNIIYNAWTEEIPMVITIKRNKESEIVANDGTKSLYSIEESTESEAEEIQLNPKDIVKGSIKNRFYWKSI